MKKVLVIGWQPPPHNGRSHEVSGLTAPPFSDAFSVSRYDTKLQNEQGERKLGIATRNAIRHLTGFRDFVQRDRPDVAILFMGPGISFWHDMFILRTCHRLELPTVVRFIGGRIAADRSKFPLPLRMFADRNLAKARMFLTETHEMVQQLQAAFPEIPAHRVPNFIHEGDLPRETEPSRNKIPEIVFLGNLTPTKGVQVVLDAVDTVCDRFETTFHFVGGEIDKGYLQHFRALANKLQYTDRVKIHGRLPRSEAHQLAGQCRIFAFPTQWPGEGQPAALLECMGMGLVPVVCRWRGVAEIVSDNVNGLSIERPHAQPLAQCILRLLEDPELLSRLSANARRTVLDNYTATVATEQYKELLAGVV